MLCRLLPVSTLQYDGIEPHRAVLRGMAGAIAFYSCSTAQSPAPAEIDRYPWQQHCRGLFQTPIAA